jgi:FMN phosphatase YigB (HAD superfamily)
MTDTSAARSPLVFLLDVDNTLLDNDRIAEDLDRELALRLGDPGKRRYWAIFEALRVELGYADYLGALQRYRIEHPRDPQLVAVSSFLIDYPVEDRLFPKTLEVLEHLASLGSTVILSDGDMVFQPHKIERSGLRAAVDGRVLVYIHKERELDDVEARYPAEHYVLIDDKVRILAAVKQIWNDRLTTVFPRQGHYARDPDLVANPAPDICIEQIADLLDRDLTARLAAVCGVGRAEG